jgi:hypothetical protein
MDLRGSQTPLLNEVNCIRIHPMARAAKSKLIEEINMCNSLS